MMNITQLESVGRARVKEFDIGALDWTNLAYFIANEIDDDDLVYDVSFDTETQQEHLVAMADRGRGEEHRIVGEEFDVLARRALDTAVTKVFGHSREIVDMEFDDKIYWFTGGMSWGDPSSESYESMNILDELGLFETPILVAPDAHA